MDEQPSPKMLRAIGNILCEDIKRDKKCPHHERMAEAIALVVLRVQKEESK